MKRLISIIAAILSFALILSGCGGKTSLGSNNESANTNESLTLSEDSEKENNSKKEEPTDSDIKSSIIGIWVTEYKGSKLVYQFNEDGSGMASIIPMTYTVENGVITITASAFGKTETGSASYKATDNTLTLTKDGDTIVMKKTTMEELENE